MAEWIPSQKMEISGVLPTLFSKGPLRTWMGPVESQMGLFGPKLGAGQHSTEPLRLKTIYFL